MEHKAFQPRESYTLLILKYVKENDGCTVAEVKQHLGIPLNLPPLISTIGPANRISIEIAIQSFKRLAMNKLIRTDQNSKSIKLWGLRIDNSSHLHITSEGDEVLNHGEA